MIRSNFSTSGVQVGDNNVNMTYAYGLGDFFSIMFEDTSVPNLILESDTLLASEVYSKFLQFTSGLSLEEVQVATGSQIKLALINSNDLVPGTPATYRLKDKVVSANYIANRPLLPTELLESKVDFDLYRDSTGDCYVKFAQRLDLGSPADVPGYAFSSRLLVDGSTQYAIWFVDAHIDESLVYSCFGRLVQSGEKNSSEEFANFVYGLYYLYTQGPTLTTLRRGLNLVIGIPLARMQEEVLDIRMYLQTDQYIVLTDRNQYIIPYGLPPSVSVGDVLSVGQELAQWVEVKDYAYDGDWWVNLYIPNTIVPEPPSGDASRYAVKGSQMDYLMREYLKTHTFLVRVNVTTFKNNQAFTELYSVINRSKPAYAQPIYVWAVSNEENFLLSDETPSIAIRHGSEDDLGYSFDNMKRSSTRPLSRGFARFIRFNAPAYLDTVVGESSRLNSSNNNVQTAAISGYSNPQAVMRGNSWEELDWISILMTRSNDTWRGARDQVGYRRGNLLSNATPVRGGDPAAEPLDIWSNAYSDAINTYDMGVVGRWPQESSLHKAVQLSSVFHDIPAGCRVVPLTILSVEELNAKLEVFGLQPMTTARLIIDAYDRTRAINTHAISYPVLERALGDLWPSTVVPSPIEVVKFFGVRTYSLAEEDTVTNVLDVTPSSMGKDMCKSMLYQGGVAVQYASESDKILLCSINCRLVGVYLLTYDAQAYLPSYLPVENPNESVAVAIRGIANRGMAIHNSPFYLRRGSLSLNVSEQDGTLEDPSTQLANFLYAQGIPESAKIVPLTVVSDDEIRDKAEFWKSEVDPVSRYSFLPHPYKYREAAERILKKSRTYVALSPSLNTMFQDKAGTIPVTDMEQPVGLLLDRYGFGASAYQSRAAYRPVVRARYNLLRFTSFEGTVGSLNSQDIGTPPLDWSIVYSAGGSYIRNYSNSAIRLESTVSAIVIGQTVSLPALTSARYHIVISLNSANLALRELVGVKVLSSTCVVKYYVDDIEVSAETYIPGVNTSVVAVIQNATSIAASLSLRFGVGVYSSTVVASVTGTAVFKSPDYRYDIGQTGLPAYQRVGNPVAGTSTNAGVPDYETIGFPPYLSFNGTNNFLTVSANSKLDSDKVTVFASLMRPSNTANGTPFELWSNTDSLSFLLQENSGKILSENTLSSLLLESTVRLSLVSGVSVTAILEGLYSQVLSYSFDSSSTPIYGTYSAVADYSATPGYQELTLYKDGDAASYTTVSTGPVQTVRFKDININIGSAGGSSSFFEGNLFSIVVVGSALTTDEIGYIEDWIDKELTSYSYKSNSKLYHYPDFFRRDGAIPAIEQAPLGNIYEYTPDATEVDVDWGYDKILLYRINRYVLGLYWVSSRPTVSTGDYWTVSYQGIPRLVRVDSGAPAQNGLVVVPPFAPEVRLNYGISHAVNAESINALISSSDSIFLYSDSSNTNILVSRSGMSLSQNISLQ